MKKLGLLAALLVIASVAFAEEGKLDAHFPAGVFSANVGLGYAGSGYWASLAILGGAEYTFAQVDVAEVLPLTFGAAARAVATLNFWALNYSYYNFLMLDVGVFATMHISLKNIKVPEDAKAVNNLDYYIGLGPAFNILKPWAWYDTFGLGALTGVNYFLNPNLIVYVEYMYSVNWNYTTAGLVLKF